MAAPVGRPSKYDPAMTDRVLDLGREGCSRAEIAAELGITRDTLYRWEHTHEEFSDALQRATDLSLAWWERQGRENLSSKEFNPGLYKQCMSGRFPSEPYRERVEHTGRDGGPMEMKTNIEASVTTVLDTSKLTDEQLAAIASIRVGPDAG